MISFIGLLQFVFLVVVTYCKIDNCQWNDRGIIYDLTPLRKPVNYQVSDSDTSMGIFNMVYEFNFCTQGVKCQGKEAAALEALEVMGKITDNCDLLGLRETQQFTYLNPQNPDSGVAITYSQGDMCFDVREEQGLEKLMQEDQQMAMSPRAVTFEVSCSAKNDDNFHVIDSSKCHIRLGINHIAGCREGNVPSTFAAKFLKYSFFFALVYFGGGTLFNIKKRQLQGAEAVPNIQFWREFPFLVKDGINFTIKFVFGIARRITGGKNANGQGYDTV